jgi:hypothetical protein
MAIWYSVIDKTQKWFLAVAGVIGSALAIYAYGRHRGSEDLEIEMERADHDKAQKIEDAADKARRADGNNVIPIERLRRYKRIRDL